jgi:hypothetical protein
MEEDGRKRGYARTHGHVDVVPGHTRFVVTVQNIGVGILEAGLLL